MGARPRGEATVAAMVKAAESWETAGMTAEVES
jgi:hypothetical protein